jgi:hypothetical protein
MNIDTTKVNLLNINTYINSYYDEYSKYNLYNESLMVMDYFFNTTKRDYNFFNGIKYSFFNFSIDPSSSSVYRNYKNRFLLTIENNNTLAKTMNSIKTPALYTKVLKDTEDFVKKTTDVILAKNNNINCTIKDVKTETRQIYESLLKSKQEEQERNNAIREVDIILNSSNNRP